MVRVVNDVRVSENFMLYEFQSPDTEEVKLAGALVERLQMIRAAIGGPVIVVSGYRTPAHNKRVGGAEYSQHLLGKAADVRAPSMSAGALYELAEKMFPGGGGLGFYPMHLHIDVRGTRARWEG